MSGLFGKTFDVVEATMRFQVTRQSVLSSNVANADTPGYRRFDLSLSDELAGLPVASTNARHLSASGGAAADRSADYRLERGEYGDRPDRNGVDLDSELLQLSRNAGAFQQQAEVLSRLLAIRRVAVTGEAR